MPKIITFSRTYPSYHPKAGEPTYFVEKICAGLADKIAGFKPPEHIPGWNLHEFCKAAPKWHTIREGHRFKPGDTFSPRVWGDDVNPKSGRSGPYHSKMITFAPDIEVKKVWDIEFDVNGVASLSLPGQQLKYLDDGVEELIASNDGLEYDDFCEWLIMPNYRKEKESGPMQIICWNENVNY